MEIKSNLKSSMMAGNQSAIYQVESFLEEFYLFRRNVLNGKTEFFCIKPEEEKELEKKEETLKEESPEEKNWKVLTAEAFNSIVRCAKKLGIGEKVAKTGHRGVHQVGCRSRLRPYPGIYEQVAEMGWQESCGCSFRQNSGVDQRTAWLVRHLVPFGSSPLAADGYAAR